MGVAQEALELARGGAQTGEFVFHVSDVQECAASGQEDCSESACAPASAHPSSGEKPFEVATVVRLGVSMPYVPAVPYVVALGLCQFLRAADEGFGIRWPYDICYKRPGCCLNQGNRRLSRGHVCCGEHRGRPQGAFAQRLTLQTTRNFSLIRFLNWWFRA